MRYTLTITAVLINILLAGCTPRPGIDQAPLVSTPILSHQTTSPAYTDTPTAHNTPIDVSSSAPPTATGTSTAAQEATSTPRPASELDSQTGITGTKWLTFGPWEQVTALSWSRDGNLLAVAAGESIYIYETDTLRNLGQLDSGVWTGSLVFDNEDRQLASGHNDGFLRLWSLETYSLTMELEAHKRGVSSVAYQPQGDSLASGGKDAVARLWDNVSGEKIAELIGGTYAVPGLAFTPDGERLAILNGDTIRIREVSSGRFSFSIFGEGTYYSVAIDPQGERLAAGNTNNGIDIWDIRHEPGTPRETYEPLHKLAGHTGKANSYQALVWTLAFSPNGRVLASGGGDHNVKLWDPQNGALLQLLEGHSNAVTSLAFHPDGIRLASGSLDGTVIVWEFSH